MIKSLFLSIFIIIFGFIANINAQNSSKKSYPSYIDLTAKPGSQRNIGELNLLAPMAQDSKNITFINLRGQTDNNDSSEVNLGMGKRSIADSFFGNDEMVYGYYGFLDARNSENDNKFYQVTLGYEFLSDYFDFRNNFYAPINQEESIRLQNQTLVNENNTIMMQFQNKEKALYGSDIEVGTNLPWLIPFNKGLRNQFRVYGGAYYFTNDGVKSIAGPRVRAELRLYEADRLPFLPTGSSITISGEYQEDNIRGNQKFSALRLSVPLQKVSRKNLLSGARLRMIDPVVRDIDIVNSNVTTKEQAILPSGQNLSAIATASDSSSLYNATTNGRDNSIVILNNDISTSLTNTVQSGQLVANPGDVVRIVTPSGIAMNFVIPGAVSAKTITSTMPGQNPIALESGGSDFAISQNINTVGMDFAGNNINSPLRIQFSARTVDELLGGVSSGTVLATASSSDGTAITIDELLTDFTVNAAAVGNPAGCSNAAQDQCLEVVNGQMRVKNGVEFTQAPNFIMARIVAGQSTKFVQINMVDENSQSVVDAKAALLPNEEFHEGVRLLYGADFAANDNAKINYVKHIISNLLHHDNVNNSGLIKANLQQSGATLTLFDNNAAKDSDNGNLLLATIGESAQDLQADETFPSSFTIEKHGRGDVNGNTNSNRDAALEEITHLIHNNGITLAYPEKQVRLDQITQAKIAGNISSFRDLHGDADGDNQPNGIDDEDITGGSDLPRSDVDDELLSGAIEAYLNHTAGESAFYLDGRTLDNGASAGIFHATANGGASNGIVSADDLTPADNGENSHIHLRDRHANTYELVEEIFGPRDDLLTRLQNP